MSIAGILLALAALIYLAYRGISVLVLAPLVAALAVMFAWGTPLLASYTQVFMPAAGRFIALYFPLFLLGALFGRFMEDSGAAGVISSRFVHWLGTRNAILAVVLACAVLTYGGVSLFVVAFAVYPIAAAMFQQAEVPKRLIPAAIALGAFTFTMTALPGTPAIQNAIPMPYFNTTPFAAPGLGVIAGVIMFGFGIGWLGFRARRAAQAGEGYQPRHGAAPSAGLKELREHAQGEGFDLMEIPELPAREGATMPFGLALSPIVLVIALNYVFSTLVFPALDTGYLAQPLYGATSVASVKGVWAIICALVLALLFLVAVSPGLRASLKRSVDDGANAAVLPIFNTASLVGFGAVIASLPGFALIRDGVLGVAPDNPLISLSIAVNVLAGITGSASGGMSIALQTLGDTYLALGQTAGISPELMHRVTAIATGGLDALPHNGAVITLLSICRLTHRDAYLDIFMVAAAGPVLSLVAVVILGSTIGTF
ncbi:GntP family permease [Ectothiorhodospiraceae bacterium WFHF3C12]|nr:GntP family permease [Ectothiorhodospiraceae bacterium WFHF3C12]